MKTLRSLVVALVAVVSAHAAQAQAWSTDFNSAGDRAGTFDGTVVTTGGALTGFFTLPAGVPAGTDAYLALFDRAAVPAVPLLGIAGQTAQQATATLSFNNAASSPFYELSFAALDVGPSPLAVTLTHVGSGRSQLVNFNPDTTGVFVGGQFLEQPNIGTPSHSFSWFFGTEGNPWAAGDYTLNFANGQNLARPFVLDDVTVTAVPEPSSVAMMMVALAAVGFVARRRIAPR